tara:strand:+ start:46 stop:405 length:360 start_codon:yes stop_codon:yes gene_type:complete
MNNFIRKYGKSNKFGAKKTVFMGFTFDSKWESERYGQLSMLERIGEITDLQRQIPFELVINGKKICKYVADFTYKEKDKNGVEQLIVEDAKGIETATFRLKKKLMSAILNIDVKVVKKK